MLFIYFIYYDIKRDRRRAMVMIGETITNPNEPSSSEISARKETLLGSSLISLAVYRSMIDIINEGRTEEDKIPVISTETFKTYAQDWLTDDRIRDSFELPATPEHQPILAPSIGRAVTPDEITYLNRRLIGADSAYGGNVIAVTDSDGISVIPVLDSMPNDLLSGYNEDLEDHDRLTILPTTYADQPRGTVADLLAAKPESLKVASLIEGFLLQLIYTTYYLRSSSGGPSELKANMEDFTDVVSITDKPHERVGVDGNSYFFVAHSRLSVSDRHPMRVPVSVLSPLCTDLNLTRARFAVRS